MMKIKGMDAAYVDTFKVEIHLPAFVNDHRFSNKGRRFVDLKEHFGTRDAVNGIRQRQLEALMRELGIQL